VLRDRRRDPGERGLSSLERARQAERGHGRRLRLDAEVGEDVRHPRLVDQELPERAAMRRVVGRLLDRLPHRRRRPDDAVEPGRDDHLDDRPDAAALLADERSGRRACP
jgi:hypothetical protein